MKKTAEQLKTQHCRIRIQGRRLQVMHEGCEYCLKYSRGWHYLSALLEYPGVPFRPWHLESPENEDINSLNADAVQDAELSYCDLLPPLPMADLKTIKEIKQRLCRVLEAIAIAGMNHDPGPMDELLKEKEALQDYLLQVYSPKGRIREFPSEQTKQQLRVLRSIQRAISQLRSQDPFLASYLAQHLKLGTWLQYSPGEMEIVVQRY